MLTWTLLLKFWLAVVVIEVTSWLVPGFHVTWLSGMFLAVFMTAMVGLVESIAGSRYAPYTSGTFAWATGVLIVYVGQWVLPGVDSSWIGAIAVGSVLWGTSLLIPKVWG